MDSINTPSADDPAISLTILAADTHLITGEATVIYFNFSDVPTDFELNDLELYSSTTDSPGTLSGLMATGSTSYQAIFTPSLNFEGTFHLIVPDYSYSQAGIEPGIGASSPIISIDTRMPSVESISFSDIDLTLGESSTVTLTFSEAVSGLGLNDIALSAPVGTLSNWLMIDSQTYQLTLTPAVNIFATDSRLSVIAWSYTDVQGNPGSGKTSDSFGVHTLQADQTSPVPTITLSTQQVTAEGMTVTISFNEAVQNFDLSDLDLSTVSGTFGPLQAAPDGLSYTTTFVPDFGVTDASNQIRVLSGNYADIAGNPGQSASSANFTIDTAGPQLEVTAGADRWLSVVDDLTLTLNFSEPVVGFDASDFDLSGAAVDLVSLVASSPNTYAAVFRPLPGMVQATNTILIQGTGYADTYGNVGGDISVGGFSVDALAPVPAIIQNVALSGAAGFDFSVVFDEAVMNFDQTDLQTVGAPGSLVELSRSSDGTTFQFHFTPQTGLQIENAFLSVIGGGYTDLSGNPGGSTMSAGFAIDTQAPSAIIGLSDTQLTRGESLTLTFTFSEAVSGFSADDVLLDGAAVGLSAFAEVESGRVFTAVYTPASQMLDSASVFSIAAGSYADLSDNAGAAADSFDFSTDTVGRSFFGTTGSDLLIGTAGADRLSGVPLSGTGAGKGSTDVLAGLGGADVFVLGNSQAVFYNDGNNKTSGQKDLAYITDFSSIQGDRIEVRAGTYFFAETSVNKFEGTGLYFDTNGSGSWDARDELIGFLIGVAPDSVSVAQDLIQV